MKLAQRLHARFSKLDLEENFSVARHTSVGCGGTAEVAAAPADMEEAAALLHYLRTERIAHCLLGAGCNVLARDGHFEGVAVRFFRLRTLFCDGETLYAGAGVSGGALLAYCTQAGFGGFEPFAGIPTSVGGAVAMNAGIAGHHFGDRVLRVIGAEKGLLRSFSPADCTFGEKCSLFLEGVAVLGVYFSGYRSAPDAILRSICAYRAGRSSLPKGRSMGCTFVNPGRCSAGELIERCGLKGRRIGGAHVSCRHANFIINQNGTAADVDALIRLVRDEVARKTGIYLREEIRRLP